MPWHSSKGWLVSDDVCVVLIVALLVSSEAEVGDSEDNQEEERRIHRTLFLQPNFLSVELFLLRSQLLFQLLPLILVALSFILKVFVVPVGLLVQFLLVVVSHKVLVETVALFLLKLLKVVCSLIYDVFNSFDLVFGEVILLVFQIIDKHIIVSNGV